MEKSDKQLNQLLNLFTQIKKDNCQLAYIPNTNVTCNTSETELLSDQGTPKTHTKEKAKKTTLAKTIKNHINYETYLTEFLATFILVLSITFAPNLSPSPLAPAVMIGCTLIGLIYGGGHTSAAHYNPAVTFCFMVRQKCGLVTGILFILLQVFAGFLASALNYFLIPVSAASRGAALFAPSIGSDYNVWQGLVVEIIFTAFLCWIIENISCKDSERNQYYAFAIACTVVSGILCCGPISGAVFNPAVATGPMVVKWWVTGDVKFVSNLWVYWVGDYLGALISLVVFFLQNPFDFIESCGNFGNFIKSRKSKLFFNDNLTK